MDIMWNLNFVIFIWDYDTLCRLYLSTVNRKYYLMRLEKRENSVREYHIIQLVHSNVQKCNTPTKEVVVIHASQI